MLSSFGTETLDCIDTANCLSFLEFASLSAAPKNSIFLFLLFATCFDDNCYTFFDSHFTSYSQCSHCF